MTWDRELVEILSYGIQQEADSSCKTHSSKVHKILTRAIIRKENAERAVEESARLTEGVALTHPDIPDPGVEDGCGNDALQEVVSEPEPGAVGEVPKDEGETVASEVKVVEVS